MDKKESSKNFGNRDPFFRAAAPWKVSGMIRDTANQGETKMTTLNTTLTRIAAVAVLAVNVTVAQAQDFTQMDITALNNAWNMDQNAMMQAQLEQIVWQNMNDPQVQALYNQQVAQGLFWGSLADFAYKYAYTGGMTAEGYGRAIDVNRALDTEFRGQMRDDAAGRQVYIDAYGRYVNAYGQIMDQYGNLLLGQ
jgi:hypothetical protein